MIAEYSMQAFFRSLPPSAVTVELCPSSVPKSYRTNIGWRDRIPRETRARNVRLIISHL